MEKQTKLNGIYKLSEIDYEILIKIADFKLMKDWSVFDEWFNYKHKISENDLKFLIKLVESHKYNLGYYTERQLQAQFISPLLSNVNFITDTYRSWFEYEISGIINNYKLIGFPDFMVATGERKPHKPYFFIQEFKKQLTKSNPLEQLLAEMAVALEINNKNKLYGVYNIGKWWTFIILEKITKDKYQYYESKSFDCIEINDLKQIYINLQAVKHKYCK